MMPSTASAAKRGSNVMVAPEQKPVFMSTVWPKEWKSGSTTRQTSSLFIWIMSRVATAFMTMLLWVNSAPLGLPVVPEV